MLYIFKRLTILCVLVLCLRVCTSSACLVQKPEEGSGSPGTGAMDGCELSCGC